MEKPEDTSEGASTAEKEETPAVTPETKAMTNEIMRNAARLVAMSNALPKSEYTVYNSFPTFNAFMKRQEERVNMLMSRMTKSIGCPMRVPAVGSSLGEYSNCLIEAQDSIVERASTLLTALQNADRDEVVKVPAVIQKAAPTNRKTETEISTAMKTFSANIGSLLAQKFRERQEEAAQVVVRDKPQMTYNIPVDNSIAPFVSKLKEKHHEMTRKAGIVVIDEDESGRREWATASEETEEEHPYNHELLNFVVPAGQLKEKKPIKYAKLTDTPMTMVDTLEKLEQLRNTLNGVKEFAVDLEHNEARSYLGLTCLIQISTRDEDFIVDPFPIWDHVGILNEPFANPNILKVLHGADNDILWLQRDFGIHVVNMFDTYPAMKKLKYPKFSLAYLVSRMASVQLDKQYQLADWRARPLRDSMVNYAREDTHYLLYCYDVLSKELLEEVAVEGLMDVYNESVQVCLKIFKKPKFNARGFMTDIKFRFNLNSRQEYALTHLYQWRDNVAREEDESTNFVLPNHMMLALSETLPRDVSGIYACCNPLPHAVKQRLGDIFKIILAAREVKLEKREMTSAELDSAHESRGVMNQKMDELTAVLRSRMDFSHSRFDEERGDIEINKSRESEKVTKKPTEDTFLSVLLPPRASDGEGNVIVVEGDKKVNKDTSLIIKDLEQFATPYECYTIAVKEREKQEEEKRIEEERRRAEEGEKDDPKKMFSHFDPTVCRKPVFDDDVSNLGELKMAADSVEKEAEEEPPVFDERRFDESQLLSKKALKRKRDKSRRAVDISTVLGEGPAKKTVEVKVEVVETASKVDTTVGGETSSESGGEKKKKRKMMKEPKEPKQEVEDFDYEKEDCSDFQKRVRDTNGDFDPFHQKFRLKNKSNKQTMRKSQQRSGRINYPKKS